MALQDALGTTGDPISRAMGAVYGRKPAEAQTPEQGMQSRIARGTIAEEQLPGLMEAQRAEAETSQADIAAKRMGMATRGKEIGDAFAAKERELVESPEYRQKEIPAFEPSAANLEDIRNVLGLSIVAGFLTGGASKRSGMAAMAALNGAVEGFRQGRQDVYKRELDVFTKNVEAIKENNRQTLERFNRAMNLLQTDRKAAEGELKILEAETQNSVAAAAMRQGMYKQASEALNKAVEGSDRATQTMLQLKQQAEMARERMQLQRERMAQEAKFKERELGLRAQEIAQKGADLKPPPANVLEANRLRSTLIPKIESALPVIDRLAKEKSNLGVSKWAELTTLLAADPRAAEFRFKDDPEAINLILTLAYFRSKEFETAGKALTRKEDQILAPIVRGDLRVYEGIRNALVEGTKTLKQEQMSMEQTYPFISRLNAAYRGEAQGQQPSPPLNNPPVPSPSAIPQRPPGVPSNAGWSPSAKAWFWKDENGVTQKKSGV